jgi:hypothetical protein
MAQVVESLPSKHKALHPKPNAGGNLKNKTNKKQTKEPKVKGNRKWSHIYS